jgi:hypothetical protein
MLYPRRALLRLLLVLSMVVLGGAATLPDATLAQSNGQGPLNHAFQQASKEFDVPRDLLVTIAYAETHFDDHAGQPSVDNGYGLMHLVENSQTHTLTQAAALLGVSPEVLKTDTPQNIRGGAALLRTYANEQGLNDLTRKDMTEWHPVVARYSNATMEEISTLYADEAYTLLNNGISGKSKNGEEIEVIAKDIKPKKSKPKKPQGNGETLSLSPQAAPAEYAVSPEDADLFSSDATAAATLWAPAAVGNYTPANRESDYPINYVVIHTTQGSYSSAINWFQNPASRVSAHYVIRSSDGRVTQTVSEKNIAHHAGNWTYNTQSIGIEHEGYVSNPSWYTDAMYRASAALTRSICQRYGIPMTRAHIIGHNEVPGATHTDPGRYWNWTYYMRLVRNEV